jgi:PKD repeat protein
MTTAVPTTTRTTHDNRPWRKAAIITGIIVALILLLSILGLNGVFASDSHGSNPVKPDYTVSGSGLKAIYNGSPTTDSKGTITTYSWSFGDGTTDTGNSVTHVYKSAGNYNVDLSVSDNHGRSATARKTIVVSAGGAVTSTASASSCASTKTVRWFANSAPKGSNFFGPAVTDTTAQAQYGTMLERRCLDPAKVVADSYYEKLSGYATLSGDQFTAKANELAANHAEWANAYNALLANEKELPLSDGTISGSYQTLYMIPQPQGAPLIRQTAPDRPSFAVLKVGNYTFKLDCGLQPVAKQFVGVTPIVTKTTPAPQPVPSPPTPSTCVPTPGIESCGKHASYAPKPIAPVVEPSGNGYVPRGGTTAVPGPYVPPPAPPASAGAGSGSGMISTVTPPPTTAPAAGGETTTSPTNNPATP